MNKDLIRIKDIRTIIAQNHRNLYASFEDIDLTKLEDLRTDKTNELVDRILHLYDFYMDIGAEVEFKLLENLQEDVAKVIEKHFRELVVFVLNSK